MTTEKQLPRAIKGCRKQLRRARVALIEEQSNDSSTLREAFRRLKATEKRCDELRNTLNSLLIRAGLPIETGW